MFIGWPIAAAFIRDGDVHRLADRCGLLLRRGNDSPRIIQQHS
jgi:hypothetical protein